MKKDKEDELEEELKQAEKKLKELK